MKSIHVPRNLSGAANTEPDRRSTKTQITALKRMISCARNSLYDMRPRLVSGAGKRNCTSGALNARAIGSPENTQPPRRRSKIPTEATNSAPIQTDVGACEG